MPVRSTSMETFPHRLNGIRMKHPPTALDLTGDLLHREHDAGLVVGPHQADHGGILAQMVIKIIEIKPALSVHRDEGHPIAVMAEILVKILDGGMLDAAGDEMPFSGIRPYGGPKWQCCHSPFHSS